MKNKIDKNSEEYKAKKRAYAKEYRKNNPDKIRDNNIKFGEKKKLDRKINPKKYSSENKKYYENNREIILHNGSESPLISFAVGGMKATQHKDSKFFK